MYVRMYVRTHIHTEGCMHVPTYGKRKKLYAPGIIRWGLGGGGGIIKNKAEWVANSADSDQELGSVAFDLGQHSLLRPISETYLSKYLG